MTSYIHKFPGGKTEHDLNRASTVGGDRVPNTYVIVPNNDHVRAKYIFLYLDDKSKSTQNGGEAAGSGGHGIIAKIGSALRKRAFALSMLVYILILALVALFQNRKFKRWYAKMYSAG